MTAERQFTSFSVVILSLDEEANIAECIASCWPIDDIHVLDSGSRDRTVAVARDCGAQVHEHAFTSFGVQRNWAIDNIPTRHEWVFHLDADERLSPQLIEEICDRLRDGPLEAGFFVPEKLMFMGRWLKRAGAFPKYQMRLFHKGRMRFCDHGHGQREVPRGSIGTLQHPYVHFAFSKGLDDWIAKHNRYSTHEAERLLQPITGDWSWFDLVSGPTVARRRALKAFSQHVPCRWLARWLLTLFIHGGVFEGRAGFRYARLMALYEEMIAVKVRHLKSSQSGER